VGISVRRRSALIAAMTVAVALAAVPARAGHGAGGLVPSYSAEHVKRMLEAGEPVVLVDVRPAPAHRTGRLPGARSVPLADLERRLGEIPRHGRVIVYGDSIVEASQAHTVLHDRGSATSGCWRTGSAGGSGSASPSPAPERQPERSAIRHIGEVKRQPPVPPLLEDRVRWEALYQAHRPRVLRLCRLLLRDSGEADDVAQEVFLRSFQAFAESRITAWGPWLTRVAVNACRDRRRSGWWRWWRGADATTGDGAEIPDPAASPERAALGAEARGRIWRTFRQLSPRQREVLVLRYVEDRSTEDVAEALNLTTGAVKRHLFRAVRRLRSALGGIS